VPVRTEVRVAVYGLAMAMRLRRWSHRAHAPTVAAR
jgi:hypothetical protein